MKKVLVVFLTAGLMASASAFAQSAPQDDQVPPPTAPAPTTAPAVPGASAASAASLGDLTPFYVVLGAAAVGAIVIANSNDSHKSTGTTGTH